jgi:hypothetical protein
MLSKDKCDSFTNKRKEQTPIFEHSTLNPYNRMYTEEYKYSAARFYETGVNDWNFVTHYAE